MQQRTIWTYFSNIGISIFIAALTLSCHNEQVDYQLTTIYNYRNLTDQNVTIMLYGPTGDNTKNLMIDAGAEILLTYSDVGPKSGIIAPFPDAAELTIVFENSDNCLKNFFKIKNELMYDNYSPAMQSSNNNILIYNIDQEELDAATPCP